jgi:hypothetical protein
MRWLPGGHPMRPQHGLEDERTRASPEPYSPFLSSWMMAT